MKTQKNDGFSAYTHKIIESWFWAAKMLKLESEKKTCFQEVGCRSIMSGKNLFLEIIILWDANFQILKKHVFHIFESECFQIQKSCFFLLFKSVFFLIFKACFFCTFENVFLDSKIMFFSYSLRACFVQILRSMFLSTINP